MAGGLVALALAVTAPAGATACSGCHGAGGPVPALEGRTPAEIVQAMRGYRTGALPATVMDRIAKGFSEEETQVIADWLSRQRPRAPR